MSKAPDWPCTCDPHAKPSERCNKSMARCKTGFAEIIRRIDSREENENENRKQIQEKKMKIEITKDNIEDIHKELRANIMPWETDNHTPPNYVRKNGMGETVAIVDVWCGGYQSPHSPDAIGWRVSSPPGRGTYEQGMLIVKSFTPGVNDKSSTTHAIEKAKDLVDEALKAYYG